MTDDITRSPHVWTYAEIERGGIELRMLFEQQGIKIHERSTLGRLLQQVTRLSREWDAGKGEDHFRTLVDAGHANRIIQAIVSGAGDPGILDCIKRIAKKDVDLSQRVVSQGKDALWELEFLAMLKSKAVSARISEPDIVANFVTGDFSFACKKIYSDEGRAVESQVRSGAAQIKRSGRPGVVALNIDDLLPADVLLKSKTTNAGMNELANRTRSFIDRHHLRVQRFVSQGTVDGILISVTIPSDIEKSSPRFNQLVHTTMWTLDSIPPDAQARVWQIRQAFRDTLH